MSLNRRFNIGPRVAATAVADEIVILDLANGTYYGLEAVGARIWGLIGEGKSSGEICKILLEEYEVEQANLVSDVMRLLDDLSARGLINAE